MWFGHTAFSTLCRNALWRRSSACAPGRPHHPLPSQLNLIVVYSQCTGLPVHTRRILLPGLAIRFISGLQL